MRKFSLAIISILVANFTFAVSNLQFQHFDNQFNLGYGMYQAYLYNGANQQTLQQSQLINLEVERLFKPGIWLNINADMVIATNSLGNNTSVNQGTGQGIGQPASQDPHLGAVNGKLGYAFPLANQHLQVTPYALVGRNTNLAMSTIWGNNSANITNDYFLSAGLGARVEYRINNYIELYADQNGVYNWDQSGPVPGNGSPQNNLNFLTTLGAKFNVAPKLQIGVKTFYNNIHYEFPGLMGGKINGGYAPDGKLATVYRPHDELGAMLSFGFTYND